MLKLRKVAVTGGVASGKSTVCQMFKDLGAYVVDSDTIVHQLLSPETDPGKAVIELLGPDILVNRRLDRSRIAAKVFGHPTLLTSLERILHPAVEIEIDRQYEQCRNDATIPLFVVEVPLLFEIGAQVHYDAVITVSADEEQCRQRFKEKKYEEEEFNKRMARQWPPGQKAEQATYVITNNGSLSDLKMAVKELYSQLI